FLEAVIVGVWINDEEIVGGHAIVQPVILVEPCLYDGSVAGGVFAAVGGEWCVGVLTLIFTDALAAGAGAILVNAVQGKYGVALAGPPQGGLPWGIIVCHDNIS